MAKVLVVGTSHKTRGGITSVIKAHQTGPQWQNFHCRWIETHIDRSPILKAGYFLRGLFQYLVLLPGADAVHIHMAAVERKMPFVFLARLFRKKMVIHLHFPDPQTTVFDKKKAPRYKWCLHQADKVIVLSKTWKKLLEEEWRCTNLEVVYNPCPIVQPKPEYNADRTNPYILYAGNLSVRKGYADLIKAFANVKDDLPEWGLVFAGNGEIDQARVMCSQYGISDRVKLLGWVSGDDKDKAFRNASAYCLPSYAEGFPMGVLDAWAYNLPVVTTPVGGLPDIVSNGENALIFEPGDIDGLEENLKQLGNRTLREKLSVESKSLSETIFNVDNINRCVGDIYAELIES